VAEVIRPKTWNGNYDGIPQAHTYTQLTLSEVREDPQRILLVSNHKFSARKASAFLLGHWVIFLSLYAWESQPRVRWKKG
jgi:hypothetical protein